MSWVTQEGLFLGLYTVVTPGITWGTFYNAEKIGNLQMQMP